MRCAATFLDLSLSNRSRFGFFAAYLFAATMVLTVKAFCPIGTQISEASLSGTNAAQVFLGSTYGPIFAGLAGTFGIYIISSFMYLEYGVFTSSFWTTC